MNSNLDTTSGQDLGGRNTTHPRPVTAAGMLVSGKIPGHASDYEQRRFRAVLDAADQEVRRIADDRKLDADALAAVAAREVALVFPTLCRIEHGHRLDYGAFGIGPSWAFMRDVLPLALDFAARAADLSDLEFSGTIGPTLAENGMAKGVRIPESGALIAAAVAVSLAVRATAEAVSA